MKKSSKLILGVVIILIIAIICVGEWLLIDNQRKSNEKISELENQISSMNKNSSNERNVSANDNKNSTNISEKQNKDVSTNTTNETSTTSNATAVLSNEEALKLGNTMSKKAEEAYTNWSMMEQENYKVESSDIDKYKELFTIKGFNQLLERWGLTKASDGAYYSEGGYGSNPRYISYEIKVNSISENKITYKLIGKYDDDQNPTIEYDFILVNANNEWLIDEYTLPY